MKKKTVMASLLAMALALVPVSDQLTAAAGSLGSETETAVSEEGAGKDEAESALDAARVELKEAAGAADVSGGDTGTADADVSGGDTGTGDADVPGGDTGTGDADVSGGDTGTTEEKIQLSTPTNLQWGGNWMALWYKGDVTDQYYSWELYKDGVYYKSGGIGGVVRLNMSEWMAEDIEESGTYKFRVMSVPRNNPDKYTNSEWSEFSEEKTYVRPDKQMPQIVGYWSDTESGKFVFQEVEGVESYRLRLYCGDESVSGGWVLARYGDYETEYDFSRAIETNGAGKYRVQIKLISGNIDEVANGEYGPLSDVFDTTKLSQSTADVISNAISTTDTAAGALEKIKADLNESALRIAMQTDDAVLKQIKELEAAYTEENGITVNAPAAAGEAGDYVDAQKISVTGAGLNAASGETIGLEIGIPEERIEFTDKNYSEKSVQLDIQLKKGEESLHKLNVPVTITMPVPKGLDEKYLVIFHCKEDGRRELVNKKVNGDGTVTFTVTEFSTFYFTETAQPEATPTPGPEITPTPGPEITPTPGPEITPTPGPEITPTPGPEITPTPGPEKEPTPAPDTTPSPSPTPSPEQPSGGNSGSGSDSGSNQGTGGKDNVPKTGDELPAAIPVGGAVFLTALAVSLYCYGRKRKLNS